jgi:hypothetical protein
MSESRSLFAHRHALAAAILVAMGLFFWTQRDNFGPALQLVLPDTDDAMRLVQVRDWLAGQPFADTRQYRFLPSAGAEMHWSRLIDLPLAGLISGLRPLLGQTSAEIAAILLWPCLVFFGFLLLLGGTMCRLFGTPAACLAVLCAALHPTLSGLSSFGRIDHHNVQFVLVFAVFVSLRMQRSNPVAGKGCTYGWIASPSLVMAEKGLFPALPAVFSLAIGLETLPFVALYGGALALVWGVTGDRRELYRATGFALTLCSVSLLLVLVQGGGFAALLAHNCDALSLPLLVLLALAAATMGSLVLIPSGHGMTTRLASLALAGAAIAGLWTLLFPACLSGPYGALPDSVRRNWLAHVLEAMPLFGALRAWPEATVSTFGPILVASAWLGWRSVTLENFQEKWTPVRVNKLRQNKNLERRSDSIRSKNALNAERRLFLLVLALTGTFGLALAFFQVRSSYIASLVVPVAVGLLLADLLEAKGRLRQMRIASVAGLTFAIIWALPVRAVSALRNQPEAVMPRPMAGVSVSDLARLNTLPPGLVLAPIDLGPALLLHSHHSIVSAPYHRNIRGLVAAIEGLDGSRDGLAQVLAREKPDYIILPIAFPFPDFSDLLEPLPLGGASLIIWKVRQDRRQPGS